LVARIIVVDDVAQNVLLLKEILVSAYYEVKPVYEGASVVALAEEWQPDAILLDVLMPRLSGFDVCRELKANQATSHIPVIIVTALRQSPDRLEALTAGADEFLSKPIKQEILLARLRSVVRLKRLMDELRAQGAVAVTLGLVGDSTSVVSVGLCNIIIIDDTRNVSARLERLLKQDGSRVVVEPDEGKAIELTKAQAFDLMIISLQLAKGDPLRLLAKLRAADATRDTPILLIGETEDGDQLIAGLDLGANDCLILPIDDAELVLRARNHIRRKRYQDRLRSDLGSAVQLAVVDPLTGLFNRRYLMKFLSEISGRSAGKRFGVLLADIDHFKSINDRFGHQAGDLVLKNVATTLRTSIRSGDLVVRYGGEEFLIVVSDSDDEGAVAAAERLRLSLEEAWAEPGIKTTVSIGVAVSDGVEPAENVIERADRALYNAKRAGRNCSKLEQPRRDPAAALRTAG
jgi:two-component system, cell cycle response regulator